MNKARIENTNEIVKADTLNELYPNYNELVFLCVDEKCSVRMAPACIKKTDRKKPHFKKYRNQEHIETCEYAILSELYQKGKNQKLNKIEIKKIGYPSVFIINEDNCEEEKNKTSQSRLDNEDEGTTGRGNGIGKAYEFDGENIKFDRKNKVQSIERIVDWYLGFPRNRDVDLEIHGEKNQYRYFFKRIDNYTDPKDLQNERIFYGRIMLSEKNRDAFNKYTKSVFLTLLGFKSVDEEKNKPNNYSVKIDKKSVSKNVLSRLRHKYDFLFEKAFTEFKNGLSEPNIALYVFVYGTIDENNDTVLNVKQNHITFRYDEVRKTIIEE